MNISKKSAQGPLDVFRKFIFVGCNSIGFGAAAYLIFLAFLTMQTGATI